MGENNVCLIGAGGIGFRHFQSLLISEMTMNLYVVDTSKEAVERAKNEYEQSGSRVNCVFGTDNDILPEKIDILIIATSSMPRRSIFESVIEKSAVEYVIFEKFLFPRMEDYEEVGNILKEKGIKAFVNCPGRMYKGYQEIKKEINSQEKLYVHVQGSNWGLSCNAIHVIDQVGYLLGEYPELSVDATQLDDKIVESKRRGYIEFTGRLVCTLGDKATIIMDSFDSGNVALRFTIVNGSKVFTISEIEQYIISSQKGVSKEKDFQIYFQSQLSSKVVDTIMRSRSCELTSFENTIGWHKSLLRELIKKYKVIDESEHDLCPIT